MQIKTQRRTLLDICLNNSISLMSGDAIDIGGKKGNKRGDFRPPLSQVRSWQYVNIDKSTNPDYCCSADNIPVSGETFDTALLNEVVEHLENPEVVLRELHRILKRNGTLICSIPFLFPVHADPYDFQRWTETKIRIVLDSIGFSDIEVHPMGCTGSVVHDLLFISINNMHGRYIKRSFLLLLRFINPFFIFLDKVFKPSERSITTGYFITARK